MNARDTHFHLNGPPWLPERQRALEIICDIFARLPGDPLEWLHLLHGIAFNVITQMPVDKATRDALPGLLADALRRDLAALDSYGMGHG
jgi:hypothetical protein